jgi:4-hydroxy-3-polyprenylbenzoate decarboxylase
MSIKTVTLIMTGASGAEYGLRLLEELVNQRVKIYFLLSRPAHIVIRSETTLDLPVRAKDIQIFFSELYDADEGQIQVFEREQWMAPIASGSGVADATVVCPCTTGTLSSIAVGASKTLIERAADVAIKERKKLILVVRETPFSDIHLENMLKL